MLFQQYLAFGTPQGIFCLLSDVPNVERIGLRIATMRQVPVFLGLLLSGLGAIILCVDLFNSAMTAQFRLTDFGTLWHSIHTDSLQLLQPAIERHLDPVLWQSVVLHLLLTPSFIVFAVPGLILLGLAFLLGRSARKDRFIR